MAYSQIVRIEDLKITHEDKWLENYTKCNGCAVIKSPNYLALCGDFKPLKDWFNYRGLNWEKRLADILKVLHSVVMFNRIDPPIKIYRDMRINDGHKRSACLLFMGINEVEAIVVPDGYKL